MKRFAILTTAFAAVLAAGAATAQDKGIEFGVGADIVSNYVWRGVAQAGISFQPELTVTAGNFSATAWGTVDFAATSIRRWI